MIASKLITLLGIMTLMSLAWVTNRDRKHINLKLITIGVAIQILFALMIFKMPAGAIVFSWLNNGVLTLISFAKEGIHFLFGPLAISPGQIGPTGQGSIGFILAFQVLPSIVFFSSLVSLLYYLKVFPIIIRFFARIFFRLLGISGAEALCCSSSIFVGIESALTIRPHIEQMTRSELCTVLTAGMATIASTVMALYVGFLHEQFPAIAGHLISASIISAPAAILMSKLVVPEIDSPITMGTQLEVVLDTKSKSWIESIIDGANDGIRLCVGISALLLSFLGLLAMCNWGLQFLGNALIGTDLSFELILSWLYYPLTILMGVPVEDARHVAVLLGERTIVTEVVAFQHLSQLVRDGVLAHEKSIIIASYSLCGFSHVASLAIFVGGFSALAPSRSKDLAQLGFRALYAATLACLMTGCVAGLFA